MPLNNPGPLRPLFLHSASFAVHARIHAAGNIIDLITTTDSAGALHMITPRFLVKAGAGGFAARIIVGEDISLGGAFTINMRADT